MPLKYATIGIIYNYMLPVQDMTNENIMVPKHLSSTPVFNVLIVYFRFICSNNPATPAYGVYISQLIRYSRACGSFHDFLDSGLLLTRQLLNQGFLLDKLKLSLRKFYGRHHNCWPLWNICVANDHGYVPLVVNTSRSFLHSWLVTRFVTRLTRLLPFRSTWVHPRFL